MNLLERLSPENRLKLNKDYADKYPSTHRDLVLALENTNYFTDLKIGAAIDLVIALGVDMNEFVHLFNQDLQIMDYYKLYLAMDISTDYEHWRDENYTNESLNNNFK